MIFRITLIAAIIATMAISTHPGCILVCNPEAAVSNTNPETKPMEELQAHPFPPRKR